ncbi:hypothetical protein PpBr36_01864 [Pyricularia pennisetigena]|uniref:hypothetical protein n=1 Tax=Pyricularia pennisetigena TaxID=1578925 RepID=UPI00114EF1A1|nr:hypothetical protein PpBr36_01864 [Pyricularia pennisetigena]TLS28738.1 hypothetical protein PpBr36_01864 [Pyricularia pennisetigena]
MHISITVLGSHCIFHGKFWSEQGHERTIIQELCIIAIQHGCADCQAVSWRYLFPGLSATKQPLGVSELLTRRLPAPKKTAFSGQETISAGSNISAPLITRESQFDLRISSHNIRYLSILELRCNNKQMFARILPHG